MTSEQTPFHDLDDFISLPRMSGLGLSPGDTTLVTSVATPDEKNTKYLTSLWAVDSSGKGPARRLTRGATGEAGATFTVDGDLLFIAARPDSADEEGKRPRLWLLPATGGEARVVADHPGGISGFQVARDTGTILVVASVLPGSTDLDDDKERRQGRKDAGVNAIHHRTYPVRHWDHDLGPAQTRFYIAEQPETDPAPSAVAAEGAQLTLRDITPDVGAQLVQANPIITPDGATVYSSWAQHQGRGSLTTSTIGIDVETAERTTVMEGDDEAEFAPVCTNWDGTVLVYRHAVRSSATSVGAKYLRTWDPATNTSADLTKDWDAFPGEVIALPTGGFLATAHERGRGPLFHLSDNGDVTRLLADGAYSDLHVADDGSRAFAIRASYTNPGEIVAVDLPPSEPTTQVLHAPVDTPAMPGSLHDVSTTADDGTEIRSWLVLPEGASADNPAPLLLWVHGGPVMSWMSWSWRWVPWIFAARGYAVLLPDPALSTGYGLEFIDRGWSRWGAEPFTDVMAATDAAVARDDIDGERTAMMGGSFGGYMANWIAGHTDRFKAIVSHASLWNLQSFGSTTDASYFWAREAAGGLSEHYSPHEAVGEIRTPMLVIHGDKDYRVPIGEGLALWYDLMSKSGLPQRADGTTDHEFLYFPDENHWILTPQHAKIWYGVIDTFLAKNVLGNSVDLPDHLD